MTGSIALDVVIGLVFVYLLYSLLATVIQEIIATSLGFRAKVLEKAILRMLEDGKSTTDSKVWDRIKGLQHLFGKKTDYRNKLVAASFYSHPLIKYLAEDNYHSKPGYLNAQNFSKVILDLLKGIDNTTDPGAITPISESLAKGTIRSEVIKTLGKDKKHPMRAVQCSLIMSGATDREIPSINPETQLYLKSLLSDAQYDLEKFRLLLENWFDTTMERATGWYKRYVQLVLLVIGLGMAITFNVDTIAIARKLARDPKLRQELVQSADAYLKKDKELEARINQLRAAPKVPEAQDTAHLKQLREAIGSRLVEANNMYNEDIKSVNQQLGLGWKGQKFQPINILGWLLTALAISLGAPFWFDLLNKLMKLRGSGTKIDTETGSDVSKQAGGTVPLTVVNNPNNQNGEEAVG